MSEKLYKEATELLLSSIHRSGPDGLITSFLFGRPGAPHWDKRLGVELHFRQKELVKAALYVRQHGPAYLRYLPIGDVCSMLNKFVRENYWHLADETYFQTFNCSFAQHVSDDTKLKVATALGTTSIFHPISEISLFPLVPVSVTTDFEADSFFLSKTLRENLFSHRLPKGWLKPEQFPPLSNWEGKKEIPSAWLGIWSPTFQVSEKMKAAILGALALTPLPRYRHMFSGRQIFGGRCVVGETVTTSFGEAHTPPLMEDIIVSGKDHGWLTILAKKLNANDKATRRQLRALEYFYRAWPLDPRERFPILCMSVDALFGDASHATGAVVDSVSDVLDDRVEKDRLRLLMKLRGSVIHGGAPDVYDSSKYARYYDVYEADPIHDLELVVGRCLRTVVFEGALQVHPDPHAKKIAEMQAMGRLSTKIDAHTIFGGSP